MHNSGTTARARLRMAAIALGALALASCTDAFSPRNHGRDGTVVQLSPDTRAELVSPSPGTLELRFVAGPERERVQSFQGEIRFEASRYRVVSATAGEGATASWHGVEPGRIRFAGVATDGTAGRGIVFRFEEGESFRADDFRLVVEEAVLRSELNAAPVRFAAPAAPGAGAAGVSGESAPRNAAQGGTPAAQAAWEMRGDVNGDGGMDAVDALAVLSHVVGKALPATFVVQPQGDVSRDGAVTAADALLMLEYRVGRDRVVDVRITTSPGPVDVADSLVLAAELRGVRGELLNAPVAWSCPDSAWVRECGPRLFRPAVRATPSPVPVRLVATSGGRADTLEASVFEQAISLLRVDLRPYPASVSSNNTLSQQTHAIRAIPGGTTTVFVQAQNARGELRLRPLRVSVGDTTLFSAQVGELQLEWTPVVVTGKRAGSGILTVLVNGVSVPVRVEVAAPAALACSPANSLPLDLAPGEIRTFRGSDPGAPGCLDFRAQRDRGRQYLVLTFALPYSTGRAPNAALELFDFEGQALFYGAGEAVPADYPLFRFYTPDVNAASLAAVSRGGRAALGAEPGHTWRVGGATLREGRP
ncbi:MAG TPA: dockerin type I repeat-containing protein, partial [Longimicrobium sp.]|nr:dockerin type I repeat-containing protein [Longimicrobium sp.]